MQGGQGRTSRESHDPSLILFTEINSRWILDPQAKEEQEAITAKQREKLQDFRVKKKLKISRTFITVTKTLILQEKNYKWDLKNNNLGLSKIMFRG